MKGPRTAELNSTKYWYFALLALPALTASERRPQWNLQPLTGACQYCACGGSAGKDSMSCTPREGQLRCLCTKCPVNFLMNCTCLLANGDQVVKPLCLPHSPPHKVRKVRRVHGVIGSVGIQHQCRAQAIWGAILPA